MQKKQIYPYKQKRASFGHQNNTTKTRTVTMPTLGSTPEEADSSRNADYGDYSRPLPTVPSPKMKEKRISANKISSFQSQSNHQSNLPDSNSKIEISCPTAVESSSKCSETSSSATPDHISSNEQQEMPFKIHSISNKSTPQKEEQDQQSQQRSSAPSNVLVRASVQHVKLGYR